MILKKMHYEMIKRQIIMEKLVRVPFDLEMAKKITSGEIEGRIVTRNGRNARVVCWDKKSDCWNNIVALIDMDFYEKVMIYRVTGIDVDTNEKENDLMLETPEYLTFKDGDVVVTDDKIVIIRNPKMDNLNGFCFSLYVAYDCKGKTLFYCADFINQEKVRFATEEEKQILIKRLKASKQPKDKEHLKRFFGIEEKQEHQFKPFDKVLVREDDDDLWRADFFSNMEDDIYCCVGDFWEQCIPYEGNEKLLGTCDSIE